MAAGLGTVSSERHDRKALFALVLACSVLLPVRSEAQSGANVVVIINEASADSTRIGEYYARQRHVPSENIIRVRTVVDDLIDRSRFVAEIERPLADALSRRHLQDKVLYLVLTKGVPLRIAGTEGLQGTTASVDSELTLLYRRMVGEAVLTRGSIDNPYYLHNRSVSAAVPFTHREHDIFLVSRLDAFTVREALALVDRCAAPSSGGQVVLDQRGAVTDRVGDNLLQAAGVALAMDGHADRVVLGDRPALTTEVNVVGYYSWGSVDPDNRRRTTGIRFVPGAIAASFVSTDARTFREPPPTWMPTESKAPSGWFAGSAQSLTGDLIRQGVSGAAGQVAEPYLQSAVRPEILFPAYLAGFNLVESFYLALPHLSWQTVVVGDPLCRVARGPVLTAAALDPGIDAETEVPAWFGERQKKRLAREESFAPTRAITLWVRAENLLTQGNPLAARQALEEATRVAPELASAHLRLAALYSDEGNYEAAIERYRRTLSLRPDDLVALNNLAYALAVHRQGFDEALSLAARAVAVAPRDGSVIDTLAWIEHLKGDTAGAARRIAEAVRRKPNEADIRLHAAIIYAAVDALAAAKAELAAALRLDPRLATRDEVRALQGRLDPHLAARASAVASP